MPSKMTFRKYSGNYQLRIETPEDILDILDLPEAHWTATSAPAEGMNCDPVFLRFLDHDGNGRIRTDEVKDAITWSFRMLSSRERIIERCDALRLDDIDASHDEGQMLRASTERILSNLGLADAQEITLSQVRDRQHIMASAANNGDGVLPPSAAEKEDTVAFMRAVMDTIGSTPDASGTDGITAAHVADFMREARAFLDWQRKGLLPENEGANPILPWGEETSAAASLVRTLDPKIRDYFAQCDMVRFDDRTAPAMGLSMDEISKTNFADRQVVEERLRLAPLAPARADGLLAFDDDINPAYADALDNLRAQILGRALGEEIPTLDRDQWASVTALFAPHHAWLDGKQGGRVEKLGTDALRAFLEGTCEKTVSVMIAEDEAVARELDQVRNIEKLILYQKWLLEFVNCFVSFPRLYNPALRSLFEMGTFVVDGRELTFSVGVKDRKAHKAIASASNMHVLYVEVTGKHGGEEKKFDVVCAVTSGDSVGLTVGKRGVFFTVDGREWDGRVADVIANPVSLREAMKSPFQKVGDFIRQQVEKFGKAQQAKIETAVVTPTSSGAMRDILLAGSVGLAALGSSFAFITKSIAGANVGLTDVLAVLAGIIAICFGPSLVLGYLRLRRRDLTALLEASGWAINIRMRLTRRLGNLFTIRPQRPTGSSHEPPDLIDPFLREVGADEIDWERVLGFVAFGAACVAAWYGVVRLVLGG